MILYFWLTFLFHSFIHYTVFANTSFKKLILWLVFIQKNISDQFDKNQISMKYMMILYSWLKLLNIEIIRRFIIWMFHIELIIIFLKYLYNLRNLLIAYFNLLVTRTFCKVVIIHIRVCEYIIYGRFENKYFIWKIVIDAHLIWF